jgi:ferredoxin--NADP+ reductase
MVFFQDRRTPDLQFDHVVLAYTPVEDAPSDRLSLGPGALHPSTAWDELVARFADRWPPLLPAIQSTRLRHTPEIAALREELYNATITAFEHWHTDLWVLRIRPDAADTSHRAGQYATLGLGYWEPRVDDADESLGDEQRARLIRRSYSISSRVLDEHGYLVDPSREDEVEFYIVHVRPDAARIPALTPRLADKRAGDRIYLGPKVTGRYTLDAVTDPFSDVVFLATGTGEAPHNAMIGELLRKGHHGSIVSVVSVRRLEDLGYRRTHQVLAERWPNYTYVVVPTREPGWEKRYVQDVISSGELAGTLAHGLDPARTHVFACGNPSMIGLPEWDGDTPVFPATVGIAGLLTERGFTLDRRGTIGTIHYEEYW